MVDSPALVTVISLVGLPLPLVHLSVIIYSRFIGTFYYPASLSFIGNRQCAETYIRFKRNGEK